MKSILVLWRRAAGAALQWRLLLWWVLALALPTLLVVLPLWRALSGLLNHALASSALALNFDPAMLVEVFASIDKQRFSGADLGLAGLVLTLLLSPWLTGLLVTSARANRPLGMGDLFLGGWREYGRLGRMLLWSVVPLGIAAGLGGVLLDAAGEHGASATLEAEGDRWQHLALGATALLMLVAQASLDAGRAVLALNPHARSAVVAWWRGWRLLLGQRGRGLWLYLLISLPALAGLGLLALLRVHATPVGVLGVSAAVLLGLALVVLTAWMRGARLFALIETGRERGR